MIRRPYGRLFYSMTLQSTDSSVFYQLRNWDTSLIERPILFLHSALSTQREFDKLSSFYEDRKQILLDFPSHGESTTTFDSLTTQDLARFVRDLLEYLKVYSVDIIGYSLGGYVAIELALIAPSTVHSIVSHAMKFYWTEDATADSLAGINPAAIKARSSKGYEILSGMHGANGLDRTSLLMKSIIEHFRSEQLTPVKLREFHCPLLLSVGDRDALVPPEEVSRLYLELEKSKTYCATHPNSPHQLSKLDLVSFTNAVRLFYKTLGN